MEERLHIISNRLPVTLEKKGGSIQYKQSMGGLATGLGSFYKNYDSMWTGWCGMPAESLTAEEKEEVELTLISDYSCLPIFLSRSDIKMFYHGFCNKTIWPLFHYFPTYTVFEKKLWESYEKVNSKFCEEVLKKVGPKDTIWVHDYQLLLLPGLLRKRLPEAKIGFFLHIPFPSFEIFRLLPWRKEILEGLLGADLIGFHTFDYVRHFLSSVGRLMGYEHTFGQIYTESRVIAADIFPMGIDFNKYHIAHKDQMVKKEIERVRKKLDNRKAILSVDRLDYTKGILHRLKAYEHFLSKNQKYHKKVALFLVVVPSRTGVDTYAQLKRDLDERIGRINGKYGSIDWTPVLYFYRALPFHTLTALYYLSDVALVTPLRDGMNLIAKEYIAARGTKGGNLILSGMAGAVHEMSEALIVNPHNMEQVADALKEALEMPLEEQIKNNATMQDRLARYNIERWAQDFMQRLNAIYENQKQFSERIMTSHIKKKLIEAYVQSSKRLMFLDYDGTVVNFAKKPQKAIPNKDIKTLLRRFSEAAQNEVVILSGRDKDTLTEWFHGINVGLVAEHGFWLREKGGDWREIGPLREDWKDAIRPVFELYMDRTPGSLIEEKSYSLVWHYRMSDPDLATGRVNELKETLIKLTENLNLGIIEGKKVIEVKAAGINKGNAVMHWLAKENWDFILAAGDDTTDDDAFDVLPDDAYSIKVGLGVSKARFNVKGVNDIRSLLHEMLGVQD
jgi:trehalose 6-phosphate synthase/phosphatase